MCDQVDNFSKILGVIKIRIKDDISIKEYANDLGWPVSKITKILREHNVTSIKTLRNEIRLDFAYQEIKTTDKSILDIAINSGFNQHSYFTKAFVKKYRIKPSDIRKRFSR